jgi:hypothetical protein
MEPGADQVNGAELRAAEISALEPGTTQIGTNEISHATTLASPADGPPAHKGGHWSSRAE